MSYAVDAVGYRSDCIYAAGVSWTFMSYAVDAVGYRFDCIYAVAII